MLKSAVYCILNVFNFFYRWLKKQRNKSSCIELKLTHFDNTQSTLTKTDGNILHLLNSLAPRIINLKVRLADEDIQGLISFRKLRHLEIRCFLQRGM